MAWLNITIDKLKWETSLYKYNYNNIKGIIQKKIWKQIIFLQVRLTLT